MNKRVALWDNLKFILITFVVVGHFIDEFTSQSNLYRSIFILMGIMVTILVSKFKIFDFPVNFLRKQVYEIK